MVDVDQASRVRTDNGEMRQNIALSGSSDNLFSLPSTAMAAPSTVLLVSLAALASPFALLFNRVMSDEETLAMEPLLYGLIKRILRVYYFKVGDCIAFGFRHDGKSSSLQKERMRFKLTHPKVTRLITQRPDNSASPRTTDLSMPSKSGTSSKNHPRGGVTDDPLVWIDCEMTGLNIDTEEIIEIYCVLTTGNLELMDEQGYHAIIHWPESRMKQMGEWCTKTHAESGLTAAVLESTTTPEQAAQGLYDYITRFIPERKKALLAGNSVWADREFLRKEPYAKVIKHLHHRILDVSSIKEAARRWGSEEILTNVPSKKAMHKAKDDILESIEEAKYYRNAIFKRNNQTD